MMVEAKTSAAPVTQRQKNAAFVRSRGCCYYCGDDILTGFEIDHIVPRSRGGTSDDVNLAAVCHGCNRSKGGKTLATWRDSRGGGLFWFEYGLKDSAPAENDVERLIQIRTQEANDRAAKAAEEAEKAAWAIRNEGVQLIAEAFEVVDRTSAAIEVLAILVKLGPVSPAWQIMLRALDEEFINGSMPTEARDVEGTTENWQGFLTPDSQVKHFRKRSKLVNDAVAKVASRHEYNRFHSLRQIRGGGRMQKIWLELFGGEFTESDPRDRFHEFLKEVSR